MNLSNEEKMMLGDAAEMILSDDRFNTICNIFETSTVQQLLSTKSQDRGRRDELFFCIRGVRDFLALMAQLAAEKNRLIEPVATQPSYELDEVELLADLPPEDADDIF